MTLTHIFVFAALGLGTAWLLPKQRQWLMLGLSIVALFWLQPSTPIRNLGFWLPLASLGLTASVWAITQRPTTDDRLPTAITALVIIVLVVLMGLLRYIELPFPFLASQPPAAPILLMGLAIVVALVLIATRLPATTHLTRVLWVFLFGLIALFIVLKAEPLGQLLSSLSRTLSQQPPAEASARDLSWLGFSYIVFRLIHVLREKQNNKLPALSLREFFIYVLFFPTLTAGPLDRSERFAKDLRAPFAIDEATLIEAARRIIIGLFKKFALADTLALISLNEVNAAQLRPGVWAWVVVFAYALRIYFDFSGYTDIALGLARCFGIKLPENFNNPYLKPNLTQFWNNWHISLSQWFRVYWFNPLTRSLRKSPLSNHQSLIIFLCQSSTMLLIALWHGITLNFVAWGIWHALGLFVHNRWADVAKTKGWTQQRRVTNGLGAFATFVFVSLGWVWFALPNLNLSLGVFKRLVGL